MDLFSSVTELRGIGPTRAKQLQRLHIETLYDLIAFFPRAYEDRTKISSIAGLEPGIPACFEAMVISNPQLSRIRKGMELVKVRVADETGRVDLVFFNQPYVKDQLVYGESYRFYGALRDGFGCQMQNPAFERAQAPLPEESFPFTRLRQAFPTSFWARASARRLQHVPKTFRTFCPRRCSSNMTSVRRALPMRRSIFRRRSTICKKRAGGWCSKNFSSSPPGLPPSARSARRCIQRQWTRSIWSRFTDFFPSG